MPDPVEQIFLQARAPSGSGNDLFNAFSQGVRNAQENRKLSMEEAASVLQNESNRLAIQEHGLNIELKRKQMERDAQILAGQNEALDIMLMAGQDESGYLNPEIEARLHSLAIRNPAIFTAPAGQALLHNWQGARVASKAMTDAGMANLKPTRIIVDPVTGKESITYGEENTSLDELRRAQAYKYNTQGDAILEGGTVGGKPTAFDINSRLYAEAKAAVIAADNARQEAQTPEERTATEAAYQKALNTFEGYKAFAPHANEAAKQQTAILKAKALADAKVRNEAFRATHQAILTKLRNLYSQQAFVSKAQKPALDEQIKTEEARLNDLVAKHTSQLDASIPTADEEVPVISPDGVEGTIPKANLDKALQRGFKLKQ